MSQPLIPKWSLVLALAAAVAVVPIASAESPAEETTAYKAPKLGDPVDGKASYLEPRTWTRENTAGLAPGTGAPADAVVHYLASRVRGDKRFHDVLVEEAQRSERLNRKLETHDQWSFESFRLVGTQDAGDGKVWVKVWMTIRVGDDQDEGTDDFTVIKQGDRWLLVSVPT